MSTPPDGPIRVTNDRKGKYQSSEVVMDLSVVEPMYHGTVDLAGYGADEAEARMNLLRAIYKISDELIKNINEMKDAGTTSV